MAEALRGKEGTYVEGRTGWRKFAEVVTASLFLVVVTLGFVLVGARGPRATQGTSHTMYMCVVPQAEAHIWNTSMEMVDDRVCTKIGRKFVREDEDPKHIPHYPLKNIIFYSYVPYLKDRVMSREFEFLILDLQLQFMYSRFIREFMSKGHNTINFEVALGYRDGIKGPWKRKAAGNVSRLLNCRRKIDTQQVMNCEQFPLLELGSCHHKQYLVNFYFTGLPLGEIDDYRGLSQVAHVNLYGIHQSLRFTRLWLQLKAVLFPITLLALLWFLWRLVGVTKIEGRGSSTLEKYLGMLGACLVFLNFPFQYLSLYFDFPWLLVLNDFRQGLFIASLLAFWIIFVAEHNPEKDVNTHIGHYWKEMAVIFVACIFMFVYEFCERGIQVMLPFYSLWGSWYGIAVAYTFFSVASMAALLYLIIFLVALYRSFRDLRKKQNELQNLSPSFSLKVAAMFGNLRFFLILTLVVAVCSVVTVVLPTEVMLHQWQHDSTEYNTYSGILTGNYGMWNAYCLIMLYIYAPTVSKSRGAALSSMADDQSSLQKLLTKKSQS